MAAQDVLLSRGEDLAEQLFGALRTAPPVPSSGARDLPVLTGPDRLGGYESSVENALAQAVALLRDSQRIFLYGNSVMMQTGRLDGAGLNLITLRSDHTVAAGSENWLSNIFLCKDKFGQFPMLHRFASLTLTHEPLLMALPRIQTYAHRPLFDRDFILRGPGWHASEGILVHGPAVEPAVLRPTQATLAIDRLPPRLRQLLVNFCFAADADVANTLGLFITGLLVNHFVLPGKPIALVDGNQPDTGKSWLMRTLGIVLDGIEPVTVPYESNEEELPKKVCARLRETPSGVLLIDNAKTPAVTAISSPFIESTSVGPEVSIRILGTSTTYTRPNDLIWAITMNETRASADLISRGLPIRLFYEGEAEKRKFEGPNPIDYARENRLEILGELAGMVVNWNTAGRPKGSRSHRLTRWAEIVGGIVETAGFPEFLSNAQAAAVAFNTATDGLAALAEAIVAGNGPLIEEGLTTLAENATTAADWEPYFRSAKVLVEELDACKSQQARAIRIGKFLSPLIGKIVPIQVKGRTGTAELVKVAGRSREKNYGVVVRWDSPSPEAESGSEVTNNNAATTDAKTLDAGPTSLQQNEPASAEPVEEVSPPPTMAGDSAGADSGNSEAW